MSIITLRYENVIINSIKKNMNNLSKNELIALKFLSDKQDHEDYPLDLTAEQFCIAIKDLKAKEMVYASFGEGCTLESCKIKTRGIATLDDIISLEKKFLRNIIRNRGLTSDQFELMRHALKTGKCANIFNLDWEDYKDQIWKHLYEKKLIESDYDKDGKNCLVLTRLGKQTVEEIEEELYEQISGLHNEIVEEHPISPEIKIKDSGFRINENRITDIIKTVWSMHDVGMFVDKNGNKPTVKSVMDAFAEFLQAKQFENYSSYMNKALQSTKKTYLDVFVQMEESAEKHYDEKKEREIDR